MGHVIGGLDWLRKIDLASNDVAIVTSGAASRARLLATALGHRGLDAAVQRVAPTAIVAGLDRACERFAHVVWLITPELIARAQADVAWREILDLGWAHRARVLPLRDGVGLVALAERVAHVRDSFPMAFGKDVDAIVDAIHAASHGTRPSHTFWSPRPLVVGLAGPSGAGKSWLADAIAARCRGSVVDMDGYYRDNALVKNLPFRHDNPASIDFARVLQDIDALKRGASIELPVYDFHTHSRIGTRVCEPTTIVLVEGLFAFGDAAVRAELDLKVWVEAVPAKLFQRRLARDQSTRGRSVEEVTTRWVNDVEPSFVKHLAPLRDHADLVISNDVFLPNAATLVEPVSAAIDTTRRAWLEDMLTG